MFMSALREKQYFHRKSTLMKILMDANEEFSGGEIEVNVKFVHKEVAAGDRRKA